MNEFKNIDKYTGHWCSIDDKEERRFYRNLFCRLIDVHDKFPKDLKQLEYIEEYFRDFIREEPDNSYELKTGKDYYTLAVYCDHDWRDSNSYRFPKCVLDDDWEDKLTTYFSDKRRTDLQKNIERLEEFLKTAPTELERLKKQLANMDVVNTKE